jgi:hypothetical protein
VASVIRDLKNFNEVRRISSRIDRLPLALKCASAWESKITVSVVLVRVRDPLERDSEVMAVEGFQDLESGFFFWYA